MSVSVQQHVTQHHGQALGDLFGILAEVAQQIEAHIRTAPLNNTLGAVGQTNVQGEQQQKLDVLANTLLIRAMRAHPTVAAVVSEEDDEPILFADKPRAEFVAIFDPLDGSSNIDVNVNTGTIVAIQGTHPGQDVTAAALQPGTAQLAALYVNYGPATMLVYTAGRGTHSFTLRDGSFLLNAEAMRMPTQGPYYSVNEGNIADFPPVYLDVIDGLRNGSLLGTRYGARYVGSFIADFHRTLLKGGVILYPPTAKTPRGKLRLLYEANPLAFIAEQAGGMAVSGITIGGPAPAQATTRIMDIVPHHLHERTTLVIGSQAEVAAISQLLATSPSGA